MRDWSSRIAFEYAVGCDNGSADLRIGPFTHLLIIITTTTLLHS